MSGPSTRVIIAAFGAVWGLASEAIHYRSGASAADVLRDLAIGWIYLYGGLAIWASRPSNPTGRIMALVGLTWFIGNLQFSTATPIHEIGTAFADVVFVALIALILAYPTGVLETRLDRITVIVLAVGTTVNNAVRLLPLPSDVGLDAPRLYVGLGLATFAYVVVIRRWLVAPRRRRSELLPVLFAGVVLMAVLAANLAIQAFAVPPGIQAFVLAARSLAPAAIPLALLVGFYRQSEVRQRALVDAMPDILLRFNRDGQVLDVRPESSPLVQPFALSRPGARVTDLLPTAFAGQLSEAAQTAIATGQRTTFDASVDLPVGVRYYEARLTPSGADEVTAIVRDFSAQRVAEAEQRAAQIELRQSRARIVEATDAERRRLERDLHDGAQQRLVSLALALRLARTKLGADGDPALGANLDDASEQARAALADLRELARGIHPAILTEAGLGPAIDSLVSRARLPTTVTGLPDRRLSPAVESTAYFVISEALANAAKHSSAAMTTVSAECPGDALRIEIADDGVGGADPGGSGLRGLADRVAAIGGRLSVVSPVGGGTQIVAEIPLPA